MTPPELPRRSRLRLLLASLRVRLAPGSVHGIDCARCGDEFMEPIAWDPADLGYWKLVQRCMQCDIWRTLMLSPGRTTLIVVRLDQQRRAIAATIERLDRARMREQVEAFAAALQRDLIFAADFSVSRG
jgi:hypothetical protein